MKAIVTVISCGLVAASCALPAFWGRGGFFEGGTEMLGWQLLLFGAVLCPITIPWLANIAWAESLCCLWTDQSRRMAIAAAAAIALATLPLWFLGEPKLELRLGYWLWLSGISVTGLGLAVWPSPDSGSVPGDANHQRHLSDGSNSLEK